MEQEGGWSWTGLMQDVGVYAQALNKGTKPPIIADRIEVKELHMGTLVRPSLPLHRSSSQRWAPNRA